MRRLVIASHNEGKVREIAAMLAPLKIEVLPQSQLKIVEADEPYDTFVENALAKARHAASASGLPALADDSGICVRALLGAPGVQSARFAGAPKSDTRNNQKLLEAMTDVADRAANYVCVMVLVRHAADPQPLIAEGEWHGEILRAPRGSNGFGYDPLFLDIPSGKTGGEMTLDEKNIVSHRGKALQELVRRLREIS
jgi:XTP/dITP diphosphohydrolase